MLVAKQAHLSDPGNERGIHSKDPAAKASAMQALRTVISMQENIESPTTRAELTIQQKREEYGLEAPNKIDSARWDVAAEGEAPDYAHQFGIAPDVVKQAMTEYVRIVQRMEPLDDAALDQLEAKYQARGDRNQSPPPTASGSARIG